MFFRGSLLIEQEWFLLVAENRVESRLSTNSIKCLQSESEEGLSKRNNWTCKDEIRKDRLDAEVESDQVQHESYLKLHQQQNDQGKC